MGNTAVYRGETSRNLAVRSMGHASKYFNKNEDSALLEHHNLTHEGAPIDLKNWTMELTGVWPLPGHRQASEGLQISDEISKRVKLDRNNKNVQYSILNSKKVI